jgi:hypothetical protein
LTCAHSAIRVDEKGRICLYPIPDEGSLGWTPVLDYVTTVYGHDSASHDVRVFKNVRSLTDIPVSSVDSCVIKTEEQFFSAQSVGLFQSGPRRMMIDAGMLYELNAFKCESDLSIESFWERKQLHYERWRLNRGVAAPSLGPKLFVSLQVFTLIFHDFVRNHVRFTTNVFPL